jgi:hypothetical protein
MSQEDGIKRAEELAARAHASIKKGELAEAARILREASSIDTDNVNVKAVWDTLKEEESGKSVVSLCQKWVETRSDDDGEITLDYIHQHQISSENAAEAMEVMLDYNGDDDMADQITGALLKNPGARKPLAARLKEYPTIAFSNIFERGDDSMNGVTDLLLDPSVWQSEADRIAAERDVFQLALAKMMSAGEDNPGRAMKSISRLLGAEATNLKGIIDVDGFDVILSNLDIRLPTVLRGQATLATAKLFELSPDEAQTLISQYVVKKVKKPTAHGLILAFSAAASVFPMSPSAASNLFLSEGFLPSLVSMVKKWKSHRLEQAALELLSAACIDKGCREGIRKTCLDWVKQMADQKLDPKRANQAALILVKIKDAIPEGEKSQPDEIKLDQKTQAELVSRFKSIILADEKKVDKQDSVEGLAYSSIQPKVKEELANDPMFLKKLVKTMQDPESGKATLFGGLTVLANLTAYLPVQSEEQKKLSELKAYANTTKPAPSDQMDGDAHVASRCSKVLEAGVIPLFVSLGKNMSQASRLLILQILNSLSKEQSQKNRGIMAQQGAIKLLLQIYEASTPSTPTPSSTTTPAIVVSSPQDEIASRTAAHALARVLISTNPTHVFNSSSLPLGSAIRPLTTLLTDDPNAEQRNLLPTFEGLLALTNLASTNDTARDAIIRTSWPQIEDLLLSENTLVQRASTELICNLSASPTGVAKFADGSARASNRLHILLALADVDDLATRKAAGGALAMLTEWDAAVEAVLAREKGVKILLGMCADENEEMRHRGAVCCANLVNAPGDIGVKGQEAVKKEGGAEILRNMVKETRVRDIVVVGIEVLKMLA